MGAHVKHLRDLKFHPGEGHLYEARGGHYLIYTGQSRAWWDVCTTEPEKLPFGPMIAQADTHEEAVTALRDLLGRTGT